MLGLAAQNRFNVQFKGAVMHHASLFPVSTARLPAPPGLIGAEQQWRAPSHDTGAQIPVSRWTLEPSEPFQVSHPGADAHHCIAMNLRCTTLAFVHAGRPLVDGRVTAGAVQVTAPGVPVRATFQAPADVLHLYATQAVLAECHADLFDRPHAGDIVLDSPKLLQDPALERLGQALAMTQVQDAGASRIFVESVSLAIVSRLVARHFQAGATEAASGSLAPLPPWRLRRATDYIDAHLSEAIGLADIAQSTGLTRMHFAAQFRRATGLRPHEYLLRRRVEHAQSLLSASGQSILDVAMHCGFRSQSHFTTVFKRFVGETPYNWRVKRSLERKAA